MATEKKIIRIWDIERWIDIRHQFGISIRDLHRLLNKYIVENSVPYDLPTTVTLGNILESGKGPKTELQDVLEAVLHTPLKACWKEIKAK